MDRSLLSQLDSMNREEALGAIERLIASGAARSALLKGLREQAPRTYQAWLARLAQKP